MHKRATEVNSFSGESWAAESPTMHPAELCDAARCAEPGKGDRETRCHDRQRLLGILQPMRSPLESISFLVSDSDVLRRGKQDIREWRTNGAVKPTRQMDKDVLD
ncbi:predicted protein [Histoplasma capsulatum var. duboisii H88]|uniref:Predicted protein n=1 Tax=Ajellomyces capsulatus (strain H88) TaxID=544711 RepID=F0UVG2_AJEC8|nr:predicted protein [Histoplasma capsulatum var. duboisii H88]